MKELVKDLFVVCVIICLQWNAFLGCSHLLKLDTVSFWWVVPVLWEEMKLIINISVSVFLSSG
jgi:hypothetical protein